MATIKAFIRTSTKEKHFVNIRFRLTDGRKIQLFHSSDIKVNPNDFDCVKEAIKAKVVFNEKARKDFNKAIADRKNLINEIYLNATDKSELTSDWLETQIDMQLNPDKYITPEAEKDFYTIFDNYLSIKKFSHFRHKHFLVLKDILLRYEKHTAKKIDFDLNLTSFQTYIETEHERNEKQKVRSKNRVIGIMRLLRSFFIWAFETEKTELNPFAKFSIDAEKYGTPFYLTIEERNQLYNFDFKGRKELSVQRDIFIFQCFVGCRVGDLMRLKASNINNGLLSYVATKTKDEDPELIEVPLSNTALEIVNRYAGGEMLLPFISDVNYNLAIKDMFRLAGLNRKVARLNPITRLEEHLPLNEVASSHLARRTFIGNLYKKVKDPNLISSMSGHSPNSKAFARYRSIDNEDKKEALNLID